MCVCGYERICKYLCACVGGVGGLVRVCAVCTCGCRIRHLIIQCSCLVPIPFG